MAGEVVSPHLYHRNAGFFDTMSIMKFVSAIKGSASGAMS